MRVKKRRTKFVWHPMSSQEQMAFVSPWHTVLLSSTNDEYTAHQKRQLLLHRLRKALPSCHLPLLPHYAAASLTSSGCRGTKVHVLATVIKTHTRVSLTRPQRVRRRSVMCIALTQLW
jgi:hypothetical protein